MFIHNRPGVNRNGTWKFNPDPYQRCRQQAWWKKMGTEKSFFPCWDPQGLWDIQVPGTWKTQFAELKWYDGDANDMLASEVVGVVQQVVRKKLEPVFENPVVWQIR